MEQKSVVTKEEILQDRVIRSGSWGAAAFGFVYLLAMKAYKDALIAFLLTWVPFVNLAVWIYYIIKAKRIAWETRTWWEFSEFATCQRIWDNWAKGLMAFSVVLTVIELIARHGGSLSSHVLRPVLAMLGWK